MKYAIPFLMLILIITGQSCDTPKTSGGNTAFKCLPQATEVLTNECETDYLCSYELKKESALKTEQYDGVINSVSIVRGDKWVFKLTREYDDNPNIADDEYKETIQFAIPSCEQRFYYEGKAFKDLKAIYGSEAFSRDRGFYVIKDGCVEGRKQADGKWLVQMNLTVTTRTNRTFDKSMRILF